jgi:tyrosyl-tRNA synthetase
VYTLLSKEEIELITAEHKEAPHLRVLQKALAKEVTTRVHSALDYQSAVDASEVLFGKGDINTLKSLNEATLLSVFEGVPQIAISRSDYQATPTVSDLLATASNGIIFKSKGEAKRMIADNGVSINREKVQNAEAALDYELLQNKYLVVQKGKKNYFLISVN